MIFRCGEVGVVFLLATLGCSDSETCVEPPGRVRLLLDETGADCSQRTVYEDVSGTFAGASDGFRVDGSVSSLTISGQTAAIPDGTFVRARFWCFYDSSGSGFGEFVLIENLSAYNFEANPIEDGSRLWLVAAGGWGHVPSGLPFVVKEETVCSIPSSSEDPSERDGKEVQRLTLSGEGFNVTAEPGETAPFTIATGDHAGSYHLHNVNVTMFELGYQIGSSRNFTITRAD
jgi:hypothetical protein